MEDLEYQGILKPFSRRRKTNSNDYIVFCFLGTHYFNLPDLSVNNIKKYSYQSVIIEVGQKGGNPFSLVPDNIFLSMHTGTGKTV